MESKRAAAPFDISLEVSLDAPSGMVFNALTRDIAAWWGEPYLISPERAIDIILDPYLGGSFYELWGGGDGACWAKVTQMRRYEVIEVRGPLGMDGAVNGVIRFELEDKESGTLLKLRHRASGNIQEGAEARYREGWKDLLETRLKGFVEEGIEPGIRRHRI